MRHNKDAIAHLPMVFMGKIHQLFQHLASFSQNSINTNKVEIGDANLETKQITIAVKFALKFMTKMLEHIDEIPSLKTSQRLLRASSRKLPR